MRRELALGGPAHELGHVGLMALRIALDERAPEHADDVAALEQREIERNLRDLAGRKADHQEAPVPGDRAQRRLRIGAADRIVDHVHALAAGDAAQRLLQVLLRVVDRLVGAALAAEGELVVGRRAGDHARAHQLADLDRRESGAAGGAEHRERLAGFEPGAVLQRMQRGAVDHREAGGAVEVERVGNLHHALRARSRSSRAPRRSRHSRARGRRREARHARADALHHAGEFGGRRERERRLDLVLAGDDQRVEEIERRGLHRDDDLAGARRGIGQVLEFEIVGAAEAGAEDGFHRLTVSYGTRVHLRAPEPAPSRHAGVHPADGTVLLPSHCRFLPLFL